MPIQPQTMEMIAPTAKEIAVMIPSAVRKVTTRNITTTKIKQMRYSCFKNSTAP